MKALIPHEAGFLLISSVSANLLLPIYSNGQRNLFLETEGRKLPSSHRSISAFSQTHYNLSLSKTNFEDFCKVSITCFKLNEPRKLILQIAHHVLRRQSKKQRDQELVGHFWYSALSVTSAISYVYGINGLMLS
ncbi:hypothetical protein Ocin01_15183 [Orchesella cincta]|uniref:Uncharacterized protein n=1 Tax=Orchesella cincta TaxID=48709 RepID=A0A1D2MF27_ORCCI|nr:hypothetical protein Ocin01_15183 [Orchesella cincta]